MPCYVRAEPLGGCLWFHLLTTAAPFFYYAPGQEMIYGMPLADEKAERFRKTLNLYGLYVVRGGAFSVAIARPALARIMGTTTQYAKVLGRHPLCVDRSYTVTPTGEGSRRSILFARSVLEGEPGI